MAFKDGVQVRDHVVAELIECTPEEKQGIWPADMAIVEGEDGVSKMVPIKDLHLVDPPKTE